MHVSCASTVTPLSQSSYNFFIIYFNPFLLFSFRKKTTRKNPGKTYKIPPIFLLIIKLLHSLTIFLYFNNNLWPINKSLSRPTRAFTAASINSAFSAEKQS